MNTKLALFCTLTTLSGVVKISAASVPPVESGNAPATTSAINLEDANCDFANKAQEINKQADHCDKIRKECLAKLPYKDLNQTCLSKLTFVDELGEPELKAIIEGGVKHIPATDKFVVRLVNMANWKEAPVTFITEFLKTKELSDIFFKEFSKNPTKMAEFIKETTITSLHLEACKQLDNESVINALEDGVFKKIEGNCLHNMPASAFKAIKENQLKNINLAALEHLTAAQVNEIPEPARKVITKEAAEHWGPTPNVPRNWFFNKSSRKEYLDNHPCSPAINWEKSMEKDAWGALSKRCEPIWKVITTNAAPSTFAINSSVIMLVLALVLSALV